MFVVGVASWPPRATKMNRKHDSPPKMAERPSPGVPAAGRAMVPIRSAAESAVASTKCVSPPADDGMPMSVVHNSSGP